MTFNKNNIDELVLNNQGLVYYCVSKFYSKKYTDGDIISKDDFVSAGTIGLIKAAKSYDSSLGKFSTYAFPHIYRSIQLMLASYSNVKIRDTTRRKMMRYIAYIIEYKEINGFYPSNKDICLNLNISEKDIVKFNEYSSDFLSLNSTVCSRDYDDSCELIDLITYDDSNLDNSVISEYKCFDMRKILEQVGLKDDEIEFLFKLFGFYDNIHYGRTELSRIEGISYEAVRQKEIKLLNKIRNSSKFYLLDDLLYKGCNSALVKKGVR